MPVAFLTSLDLGILDMIAETFGCAVLDFVMPLISALGDFGMIWIWICMLCLFKKETRHTGIAMLIAMAICYLGGNLWLKNLVMRPRPYTVDPSIQLLIPPDHEIYSFPSGHTMNSFAASATLMLRHEKFCFAAVFLASLIAFSRLYLMMHYPTDVIAGIIIGIIAAYIPCAAIQRYEHKRRFT